MKLVLTVMLLGFLVVSCKKEANVSTDTSSDSTAVNNNDSMETVIPPRSDSATTSSMADSIPASRKDTSTTAKAVK